MPHYGMITQDNLPRPRRPISSKPASRPLLFAFMGALSVFTGYELLVRVLLLCHLQGGFWDCSGARTVWVQYNQLSLSVLILITFVAPHSQVHSVDTGILAHHVPGVHQHELELTILNDEHPKPVIIEFEFREAHWTFVFRLAVPVDAREKHSLLFHRLAWHHAYLKGVETLPVRLSK